MKATFFCMLFLALTLQTSAQIPDLQIKDPQGNFHNLPDYLQHDKNYGLIIWSSADPPSIGALDDYHEYYADWVTQYNIEFLIINIDKEGMHNSIINYVDQEGYQFSLFFSPADDVAQAFGINEIPYIYILNANHEIAYEVAGWLDGSLLGQQIHDLLFVGLDDPNPFSQWKLYSANQTLFLETDIYIPKLQINLFSLDGKMILQQKHTHLPADQLSWQLDYIPKGTVILVQISDNEKHFFSKKIVLH